MVILFELGEQERGLAEMRWIWSSAASSDLRFRALLMGLQHLLASGEMEPAGELLLGTRWDVVDMPELAVLATAALRMGDYYLEQEQWELALRAFRWVPMYAVLVETQRRRLQQLELRLEQVGRREEASAAMWVSHYQGLLGQVRVQLQALEQGEDYTAGYLLRLGRAHLFHGNHVEAWVIFRTLALSIHPDTSTVEQAWFHWILASHEAEFWDEALELCQRFAADFPDSDLLPNAFFVLASTYREVGNLPRAQEVLTELIERFPGHADLANWHLSRGFHFTQLGANEAAIEDFDAVLELERVVESLRVRARYLRAVTRSGMRQFEQAVDEFEALIQSYPEHWMLPDFHYRLGTVHYSMRDYEASENMLKQYLSEFPDHANAPEARVLLGDIAMGAGELDAALERFHGIGPEPAHVHQYAVFQIGKILRATERYEAMEAHFRQYLASELPMAQVRSGQALYELGWALARQGREAETLILYLDSLRRFGNEPESGEWLALLHSLETLKNRMPALDPAAQMHPDTSRLLVGFIEAPTFLDWISSQANDASKAGWITLQARLALFEALRLRRNQQEDLARTALQAITLTTPMEAMDDVLLGEVGVALAEDGFSAAPAHLERLQQLHPRSPAKALAYYGLGIWEANREHWDRTVSWLQRFEKETPGHPRQFDGMLLKAKALAKLGKLEDAVETYNALLRLRTARGLPHVKALLGLASAYEDAGQAGMAIPYYQRIYTLYRAYLPQVAHSYHRSALLFVAIGSPEAAERTWQELIQQPDLQAYPEYGQAISELSRLKEGQFSAAVPVAKEEAP
jgi:tetratricopeptide (TPR) repeat protein